MEHLADPGERSSKVRGRLDTRAVPLSSHPADVAFVGLDGEGNRHHPPMPSEGKPILQPSFQPIARGLDKARL